MEKIVKENTLEKGKNINLSCYILLLLFTQVIISDTIIYFTKLEYNLAQIIALVLNFIINLIFIKKKIIKIKSYFEKLDLIFLIILMLLLCSTIIFPDTFYDSYSYHIYLQKNVFQDKINYDFFPGRTLTTYTYALVDRLYALFSSKFGFRVGTLPSYYAILVIYYEIKKIFDKILENDEIKKVIPIISIFPICAYIILEQIGDYYIDNICIALLLEFSYIILFENKNLFINKSKIYYLALLCGILVSSKFINAFYLVLPLILIIIFNIKDLKKLKWYDYIFIIIIGLLPMLVYMLDAIIDTGSPIFPYYNSIFKSPYFEEYNWYDEAYGTNGFLEVIFWPIILMLDSKRGYVTHNIDYMFCIGYILSILYLIYLILYKVIFMSKIKKSKVDFNLNNLLLSLIILYDNFILARFCIGYVRYGGIIPVLSMIFTIKLIVDIFYLKKIFKYDLLSKIFKAIVIFCLVDLILISIFNSIINFSKSGKINNYKGLITNFNEVIDKIKINAKCLFKDQDYIKYDIDGVWGVIGDDSAVPAMLNVDDRIVQLRHDIMIGNTEKSQAIFMDVISNNDIYIPMYDKKKESKLKQLDNYDYEVTEIVDMLPNVPYMLDARFNLYYKSKI